MQDGFKQIFSAVAKMLVPNMAEIEKEEVESSVLFHFIHCLAM